MVVIDFLVSEDDVASVDDSWNVSEDGKKDVDGQMVSASFLHPDPDRLKTQLSYLLSVVNSPEEGERRGTSECRCKSEPW